MHFKLNKLNSANANTIKKIEFTIDSWEIFNIVISKWRSSRFTKDILMEEGTNAISADTVLLH